MRASSTLIAVIGANTGEVIRRVAAASLNVGFEAVDEQGEARTESRREAWDRARQHGLIYTLVNADPLEPLVDEWAKRLEGESHELELAIASTSGTELPDYYLVDEHLPPPRVDWYLANLGRLAPARVVPVAIEPERLAARLGALPYGAPFPSTEQIAATARDFVPLPQLVAVEHLFG